MRELKYEAIGGGSSGHPELEEVAAFLDGRLSRGERAGITRHLSVCEECLELFTETARALEETSAGTAGGKVIPFDRPLRSPRRWLPAVAAAAALLAFGFAGYRLLYAPPKMVVSDLVEPLEGGQGLGRAAWTGPVYRGGEQLETDAFKALSFLVGAHLVGFQAAVEGGDSEAAGAAAQRVANLLDQAGFLDAEFERFRAAQSALTAKRPAPTKRYVRLVHENTQALEETFLEVHFDFGKWTQAGYIAARTGSQEWFERRKNRRFLSYLLRQDEEEIEPEARKALGRIREVWDRGELGPAELAGLAGQFEAILQRYQALSEQETLFTGE